MGRAERWGCKQGGPSSPVHHLMLNSATRGSSHVHWFNICTVRTLNTGAPFVWLKLGAIPEGAIRLAASACHCAPGASAAADRSVLASADGHAAISVRAQTGAGGHRCRHGTGGWGDRPGRWGDWGRYWLRRGRGERGHRSPTVVAVPTAVRTWAHWSVDHHHCNDKLAGVAPSSMLEPSQSLSFTSPSMHLFNWKSTHASQFATE